MNHPTKTHFTAKHPAGTQVPENIRSAVAKALSDGRITCRGAHRIASDLGADPSQIGIAIDLAEGRIVACQLGLFGHEPSYKTVKSPPSIPSELKAAIEAALVKGCLPCRKAWQIADQRQLDRQAVSNACEHLGIKIKPCQLGAF